jgi:hypothetical protein
MTARSTFSVRYSSFDIQIARRCQESPRETRGAALTGLECCPILGYFVKLPAQNNMNLVLNIKPPQPVCIITGIINTDTW